MTKAEVVALVTLATAAYPAAQGKDPEPVVKAWLLLLPEIPFPVAKAAVCRLCRSSVFFPNVADIVKVAAEIQPEADPLPTAAEAWEEVAGLIRTVGPYKAPAYSCDTVQRAARSLGWRQLCTGENPEADRAHFLRLYESMRERKLAQRENETALKIAGMSKMIQALTGKLTG